MGTHNNWLKYVTIGLGIAILLLFIYTFDYSDQNNKPKEAPATIVIERIRDDESSEICFVDIEESDLQQNSLLADLLDAWENPDKYENAYKYNQNTLWYESTDIETELLTLYIENKLNEKYSTKVNHPYYFRYDRDLFKYEVMLE